MEKAVHSKLYRELGGIFHPSISRQNISNYEIIIHDNLIPLNVFYPKKEATLDNVIIYITTENNDICDDLAMYTNHVVLAVNYLKNDSFIKCYDIIKYIYNDIENNNISRNNITIISDCNCKDILEGIILKSKQTSDFSINKEIFFINSMDIKKEKNKLFIPDINSYYYFEDKGKFFQVINEFLA